MIAVVTGGSGFIGQNLVRHLLAHAHDVRCLVRSGRPTSALPAGAAQFVVDYRDARSLESCEALDGADAVFHLAGATIALDHADFVRGNVLPTRRVLAALVKRGQRPRFVHVSSQAAAGPAESRQRGITEADPPRPVEAYGWSKLAAEQVVAEFGSVPATIVRPCAVFGPFDRDFLRLFRLARRGVIAYPGTAEHWMSLLHVDDVVRALIAASASDVAVSRTYFLSSDSPVQWRSLGAEIAAAVGGHVRQVDLPGTAVRLAALIGQGIGRVRGRPLFANRHKAAFARYPFWICSADRARAELGLHEARSLPDAIRSTYLWYVERGWLGPACSEPGTAA